jgi:hypothetical protein
MPWSYTKIGSPEEITAELENYSEDPGFKLAKSPIQVLLSLNKHDKVRLSASGFEGHFMMQLEEVPKDITEKKEEKTNEK